MPNNDLGTAHGKIRIDYDDRGSGAAVAALIKMQKQFESMDKHLNQISQSMSKAESTFNTGSRSMDKLTKNTESFSSSMFSAHKATSTFSKDLTDLVYDLNKVQDILFKMKYAAAPFISMKNAIGAFGKSARAGNSDLSAFNSVLKQTGMYANVGDRIFRKVFGVNSALNNMPGFTRQAYNLTLGLAKLGVAGVAFSKAIDAGFIKKFVNTKVFETIVGGSLKSAGAIEKLRAKLNSLSGGRINLPKLGNIAGSLKEAESGITRFTNRTSTRLSFLSKAFNKSFEPI